MRQNLSDNCQSHCMSPPKLWYSWYVYNKVQDIMSWKNEIFIIYWPIKDVSKRRIHNINSCNSATHHVNITCCFQQCLNVTHRWESEEWYTEQCAEGGDNLALPRCRHSIAVTHRAKRYLQQNILVCLNCSIFHICINYFWMFV